MEPESNTEQPISTPNETTEGRPDWVPEKFYKDGSVDYKAMAQAYAELEAKQSQSPQQAGKGRIERTDEAPQAEGQTSAQPTSPIPGVTQERVSAFSAELQQEGKLSDTSYAELAQLGYSKEVVDAYVEGVMAPTKTQAAVKAAQDAANVRAEILSEIGGQEVLNDMIRFAKTNLSPAEQTAYNDAVFSGDAARVKLAVQGLHSRYSREIGTPPSISLGGRGSMDVGGFAPFANNEAVVKAMSDPRYNSDSAYRAEVANRLAVSDIFQNSVEIVSRRNS